MFVFLLRVGPWPNVILNDYRIHTVLNIGKKIVDGVTIGLNIPTGTPVVVCICRVAGNIYSGLHNNISLFYLSVYIVDISLLII